MTNPQTDRDGQLEESVGQGLSWVADVDSRKIGVAASDGVVIPFGEVTSCAGKVRAAEVAVRVRDVRR